MRSKRNFVGYSALAIRTNTLTHRAPRLGTLNNVSSPFAFQARKDTIAVRGILQKTGKNLRLEHIPYFGLANKNDKDVDTSQDIENVKETRIAEWGVDQKGNNFRHPGHTHQQEQAKDHTESASKYIEKNIKQVIIFIIVIL